MAIETRCQARHQACIASDVIATTWTPLPLFFSPAPRTQAADLLAAAVLFVLSQQIDVHTSGLLNAALWCSYWCDPFIPAACGGTDDAAL